MRIAYTNNEEFNKIFKKYNISKEQYSDIIMNNLLFDMTEIIIYYIVNIENHRMVNFLANIHIASFGKQRFMEVCMKNVLKSLFTQHGIMELMDFCKALLNMSIQEIETPYETINIQKVVNLLEIQLGRVINKEQNKWEY